MKKIKYALLSIIFFIFAFISCSKDTVTFYINKPELMKQDKIAVFYGIQGKKNCESYRRLYAGFCDTTSNAFITCYDINDKKYKLSSCE